MMQVIGMLMNSKQKTRYENGEEVDLSYELKDVGRFRINICQQKSLPRLVLRLIPENIPTFLDLLLPQSIEKLSNQNRGLVLVTGITGSGKSTTLASMVDYIAMNNSYHIVTIEDPIEFSFKDKKSMITQREVGIDTKDFSKALKYALRQDPDVILVGEMRDEETILMALNAAETGHLVFSTLHTINAAETINRIVGNVSPSIQGQVRAQLASVLVGVVSQRLVLKKEGNGRVAAVEIFLNNARTKEMILDPTRTHEINTVLEESFDQGMQSFDQALIQLLTQDLITEEEALKNSSNPKDFELRLKGVISKEWGEKTDIKEISNIEDLPKSIEIEELDTTLPQNRKRSR